MTIADRIKKIREFFDITSNEFAQITGIHPVSIRKYETNKMVPGNDVIEKMSEALRLPKMIFEGLPKQYTDYDYSGDFYQQLFLLIENGTLTINGTFREVNNFELYDKISFGLNPKLSEYVILKHDGKEIPLSDLSMELRSNSRANNAGVISFYMYMDKIKKANDVLLKKHWNTKAHGSKDDYSHKLHEDALDLQMELMLRGHSWKDYMDGPTNLEDVHSLLDKVLQDGGNYYDFVDQLDVPESKKEDYITSYEDQWIENHYINKGTYPIDGTIEEKDAFAMSVIQKIEDYKEEHPNYQKEIKKASIAESKKRYEEYLAEQKKSAPQN